MSKQKYLNKMKYSNFHSHSTHCVLYKFKKFLHYSNIIKAYYVYLASIENVQECVFYNFYTKLNTYFSTSYFTFRCTNLWICRGNLCPAIYWRIPMQGNTRVSCNSWIRIGINAFGRS